MYKNIPAIVVDVGTTQFEANHPGTLYTILSRASSLGNGDINKSSIYFCGDNLKMDRLTNVKYQRNIANRGIPYKLVAMREKWIEYLKLMQEQTKIITPIEQQELKHWAKNTKLSKAQLEEIIDYHSKIEWNQVKFTKPKQ